MIIRWLLDWFVSSLVSWLVDLVGLLTVVSGRGHVLGKSEATGRGVGGLYKKMVGTAKREWSPKDNSSDVFVEHEEEGPALTVNLSAQSSVVGPRFLPLRYRNLPISSNEL